MGMLDDLKNSLIKQSQENVPDRALPKKVHGVSKKSVEVMKRVADARQEKYLGLVVDATSSRAPTWERAQKILQKIFDRLSQESGLHIRIIYFGGDKVGDLGWTRDLVGMQRRMAEVQCVAGLTQITEGLGKFLGDSRERLPENVILIGDAFEEGVDDLKPVLKKYRGNKIRVFSFYEPGGYTVQPEPEAKTIFRKIAKVTNGVFQEYREGVYLDDLVVAVAAYAADGKEGLEKLVKENSRAALTIQRELLQIEAKGGE